jgi:hypothetical protein
MDTGRFAKSFLEISFWWLELLIISGEIRSESRVDHEIQKSSESFFHDRTMLALSVVRGWKKSAVSHHSWLRFQ